MSYVIWSRVMQWDGMEWDGLLCGVVGCEVMLCEEMWLNCVVN